MWEIDLKENTLHIIDYISLKGFIKLRLKSWSSNCIDLCLWKELDDESFPLQVTFFKIF